MLLPLSQEDKDVILFVLPLILRDPDSTEFQKNLDDITIQSISHKFIVTSERLSPPELYLIFTAVGFALDVISGSAKSPKLSDLTKNQQSELVRYRFHLYKLYGLLEPIVFPVNGS